MIFKGSTSTHIMQIIVALACVLALAAAMPSDLFERFVADYNKVYASEEEKAFRFGVFREVSSAYWCVCCADMHADTEAH